MFDSGSVSFGLLALLGLLGLPQLPRLWRHETNFYDRVPGWWGWGASGWLAWTRSITAGALGGYAAILLGLYLFFVSPLLKLSRQVDLVVIWVLLPTLLVCFFLMCTIFLFNVPKFLIPPHLRHQHGDHRSSAGRRVVEP